jgi:hypothetical protein
MLMRTALSDSRSSVRKATAPFIAGSLRRSSRVEGVFTHTGYVQRQRVGGHFARFIESGTRSDAAGKIGKADAVVRFPVFVKISNVLHGPCGLGGHIFIVYSSSKEDSRAELGL